MSDPDATCTRCNCAVSDHTPDGGCNGCGSTSCLCWACNSYPCRCDRDYELIAGKLVIRDRMFAFTLAGCIGVMLAAAVVGAPGVGWAALAVALLIPAVWR